MRAVWTTRYSLSKGKAATASRAATFNNIKLEFTHSIHLLIAAPINGSIPRKRKRHPGRISFLRNVAPLATSASRIHNYISRDKNSELIWSSGQHPKGMSSSHPRINEASRYNSKQSLQGQHPEEQLPIFKPSKVPQNSPPANINPDRAIGPAVGQTIKGHSGKASKGTQCIIQAEGYPMQITIRSYHYYTAAHSKSKVKQIPPKISFTRVSSIERLYSTCYFSCCYSTANSAAICIQQFFWCPMFERSTGQSGSFSHKIPEWVAR
ncbi:hypothetical protein Nepgr_007998 [Nepenthes gracilis]|uniref:Uncharacterized protein n=1 Tax=Nepenthes gracilis TaxID=150966 RepID=A0AAD3S810_NEPGR|nr:hypothetical protein Nepgr_007998 [Nepenthes gracilis]